jgi:hypothetical protein
MLRKAWRGGGVVLLCVALLEGAPVASGAQEMSGPPAATSSASMMGTDTTHGPMAGMGGERDPLGNPMSREGSGTSWLPDDAVMHAVHANVRGWDVMVHGVEFIEDDQQFGGPRGADQFGALGWIMGMASHPIGSRSRLRLRSMFSADPWTVTDRGYPELLQSGEEYDGQPIHDRQHPHNLFMELAALYEVRLTDGLGAQLYAAPAGEPALGPPAFPHRPSAESDPYAPLSHHWQDATHVSFGVLTAALFTQTVKLEGSIFNGREPDQHRTAIELSPQEGPTLDSYSTRLTVNPARQWSLAASYGYLRSPDALEPDISQHRMTVTALNERGLGSRGHLSTALIWGANLDMGGTTAAPADHRLSNSALLETNVDLDGRNTVFGRTEYVSKSAADLDVEAPASVPLERFNIGSFVAGYLREIGSLTRYGSVAIGAEATLDVIPDALAPYYHTHTPYGFGIFLRVRAGGHGASAMAM